MSVKYSDVKVSDYEIGLAQLTGKKIANIRGILTEEFGEPVFQMTKIEFDDGTFMGCEGEHDRPYLVEWGTLTQPNFDEDTLERLYKESDDDDQ